MLLEQLESFKTEEEYRKSEGISYSFFKDFPYEGRLANLKNKNKEFLTGSAVDLLLSEPELFTNKYKVFDSDIELSDNLITVAKFMHENNIEITDENKIKAIRDLGLFNRMVDESKILAKFDINFTNYLLKLNYASNNIRLISASEYEIINDTFNKINNNQRYIDIIKPEENKEIIHQLKLEYKLKINNKIITCKIMPDLVVVDHNNKKIYLYDYKTGDTTPESFIHTSFIKFLYFYQAAYYSYILNRIIKDNEYFKDYSVENFTFIFASTKKDIDNLLYLTLEFSVLFTIMGSEICDMFKFNNKSYYTIYKLLSIIHNISYDNDLIININKDKFNKLNDGGFFKII